MKVCDVNFRDVYKQLCFIRDEESLSMVMQYFPSHKDVNGVLAYGYIDQMQGLTFEILACAQYYAGQRLLLYSGNDKVSFKYRADGIRNCDIVIFSQGEIETTHYQKKMHGIDLGYGCSDALALIRTFELLDGSRRLGHPDEILVILFNKEEQSEACWVRCKGLHGDNRLHGILLNEPAINFGVHQNDSIEFGIDADGARAICIALL